MTSQAAHPTLLVMALLGIGSGLWGLYQREPSLAAPIFAVSLLALLARAWFVMQANRRRSSPFLHVDFGGLRGKDILRDAAWIKQNLRGQDPVVDSVLQSVQRSLHLAGPQRTLGAFLLVGPTGTGKTFLAELVAEVLFPESEPLILRMNQYKHPNDVFTLIGPPPGQPGYEVGGALTRPVLENPYRVVLLDELEKSHLDVQHCLYNILDTAHCREKSSGRDVYFNACVIFATCNSGVEGLRRAARAASDDFDRVGPSRDALARDAGFEKALLARFDGVYLMDELSPVHIAEVACLQLAHHWRQYGIEVSYASPEVLLDAMRKNADFKEYGVRQLYRLIQSLTDSSIHEARRQGARKVRLHIEPRSGRLQVSPYDEA